MVHYSVLVPARDATAAIGRLLPELCQVLGQLILPYEIICIDDASTVSASSELDRLVAEYAPVRALRFDRPRGTSAALTAGLAASRGELVIGLGPHTRLPVSWLPQMISRLSRHDLVFARAERSVTAALGGVLKVLSRSALARADARADEELFWAARREAVSGLALARGAFRVLPALVARRGYRVCRLTLAADLPPRGDDYLPGGFQKLALAWLGRGYEPHLARELPRSGAPMPLPAVRSAVPGPLQKGRPSAAPIPTQQHDTN